MKKFVSCLIFLSIIVITLGFSNKKVGKEIKMLIQILDNSKEKLEKEAYKFGCEGDYQKWDKRMSCGMHKHN